MQCRSTLQTMKKTPPPLCSPPPAQLSLSRFLVVVIVQGRLACASSYWNRRTSSLHTRLFNFLVQSLVFAKAAMSKRKAPQESPNEGITDFLVGTW